MNPLIGAGLISGGLGLVGGFLNNLFGRSDARFNQRQAKELMKYQFDLQQQGIDAQNEYNLPVNQMARIQAAGLNPHLVYGNGSVVGNSSNAASSGLGRSGQLDRSELVRHSIDAALATSMNIAQVKNMKEQNKNLQAQNELIKQQALTESQKRANMAVDKSLAEFDLKFKEDTRTLDLAIKSNQVQLALTTISKMQNDMLNNAMVTSEQVKSMAQAREYEVKRYNLSEKQIGQSILQGWQDVETRRISANAAWQNACSTALRIAKQNQLTDVEIGKMYVDTLNAAKQGDIQGVKLKGYQYETARERYKTYYMRYGVNPDNQIGSLVAPLLAMPLAVKDFMNGYEPLDY